jgi:serine phosphatase RsbU (regulator of sigma subunit)
MNGVFYKVVFQLFKQAMLKKLIFIQRLSLCIFGDISWRFSLSLVLLFALFFSFACVAQTDVGKLREKYMQALNQANTEEAAKLSLLLAEKYRKVGDNTNAIFYFSEAIEKFSSYHNDNILGKCYIALAEIFEQNIEYASALGHYQRAAKHYRLAKDKAAYLTAELGAINILIKQKEAKKALILLKESTNLATSLERDDLLAACYKAYSTCYEQQNNKEKALAYRKLFDELGEKIQQSKMQAMEEQMKQEKSKQYATIHEKEKALKEKDKTIATIEEAKKKIEQRVTEEELKIESLNKEKRLKELELQYKEQEENVILLILAIVAVILLASIVAGIFVYRAYRDKKHINKQLEFQNEEINQQKIALKKQGEELQHILNNVHDSIRYAERIQQANLPSQEEIARHLPENFIIYKPKDVVSGDFYWFAADIETDNPTVFLAVGDCTGHGVPGAFMAMIGITFLKEVVNQKHLHNPALILAYMHKGIRKALQQEDNAHDDGIEIGLCMFENKNNLTNQIVYAGAKRPLYICVDNEIQIIKGDAKSVGGRQKETERVFTNQNLNLLKGTMIFMASDGYADQNSPQNEKIGTQKMLATFAENSILSVETQKQALESLLKNHQQNKSQRDDITIIGVRI